MGSGCWRVGKTKLPEYTYVSRRIGLAIKIIDEGNQWHNVNSIVD